MERPNVLERCVVSASDLVFRGKRAQRSARNFGLLTLCVSLGFIGGCQKSTDSDKQAQAAAAVKAKKAAPASSKQALDKVPEKYVEKGELELPPLPNGAGMESPVSVAGQPIARAFFEELYLPKITSPSGTLLTPRTQFTHRRDLPLRLAYEKQLELECQRLGIEITPLAVSEKLDFEKTSAGDDWDGYLKFIHETEATLKRRYRAELCESELLDRLPEIEVTQAAIKEEYEKFKAQTHADEVRVRASHILVMVGPKRSVRDPAPDADPETQAKWDAEAKAKIEAIAKLVAEPGADFSEIAKAKSEGPSAYRGGDLGVFTAGKMIPEFSEVVFQLAPNTISKPFKTSLGYHIAQVSGRFEPGILPLEAIRPDIEASLRAQQLDKQKADMKARLNEQFPATFHWNAHIEEIKPVMEKMMRLRRQREAEEKKKRIAAKKQKETRTTK